GEAKVLEHRLQFGHRDALGLADVDAAEQGDLDGHQALPRCRLRTPATRSARTSARTRAPRAGADGVVRVRSIATWTCAQTSRVARSPLVSSHALRSPARFFASSMSISEWVSSPSSIVSCTR